MVHGWAVELRPRRGLFAIRLSVPLTHLATRLIEHALLISAILGLRHVHRLSASHLGRLGGAKEAARAHSGRSLSLLLRFNLHESKLLLSLHDLALILSNLALQVDQRMVVAISTRSVIVGLVKRTRTTVQFEQRGRIVVRESLLVLILVRQLAEDLILLRLFQVMLVLCQHAAFGRS